MPKAIRIHETGGPEVLRWDEVEVGRPGAGEVLLRQTAVGLNFIDTYHRTGLYPLSLPGVLGMEGAGVVEEVGPEVSEVKPGGRVAYAGLPVGAYAAVRLMPAKRLVPLPGDISDQQAAGMMLKGLTAQYLVCGTYAVQTGETVLIHAAAGGVGLILCQWAKHLGATVIGTVSTEEKAALARSHGCDHSILYTRENVVERVKGLTAGAGVPVVYDSVGKDTFFASLDCLRPRGLMVTYGNSSGAVPPVSLLELSKRGSLYVTRPTLMNYTASREDLLANSADLFDVVRSGAVKIEVNQTYALKDAGQAHRDLEARKTTGSTVLIP
jgi:NADPH2:quinone reductase